MKFIQILFLELFDPTSKIKSKSILKAFQKLIKFFLSSSHPWLLKSFYRHDIYTSKSLPHHIIGRKCVREYWISHGIYFMMNRLDFSYSLSHISRKIYLYGERNFFSAAYCEYFLLNLLCKPPRGNFHGTHNKTASSSTWCDYVRYCWW